MLNELIKKVVRIKMGPQIPEIKRNTARHKLKVTTLYSPSSINPNNYWLYFFAVHSWNRHSTESLYCCTLNAELYRWANDMKTFVHTLPLGLSCAIYFAFEKINSNTVQTNMLTITHETLRINPECYLRVCKNETKIHGTY